MVVLHNPSTSQGVPHRHSKCVCVCRRDWCRESSPAAGSALCRFSMQGRCGCSQREAWRRPPPTRTHSHTVSLSLSHTYTHCVFHSKPSYMTLITHICLFIIFLHFPLSLLQSFLSCLFLCVFLTQCVFSLCLPPPCENIEHPVLCFNLNPLFFLSFL